jgi:phospholipid:diacylglycerol acyltransferase
MSSSTRIDLICPSLTLLFFSSCLYHSWVAMLDYFLGNYWVFGKILENLADVGYNPSNMVVEPYDWRCAFPVLEERDGYLTKLRYKIESMVVNKVSSASGPRLKVVLTSHSMGALLVNYFFQWVTTDTSLGGGGGGADWVDRHIEAYINIAGPHLGVPKAATALLSGEMSETIYPEPMGSMVEQFFGRSLRRGLWSSWGSLWSMLPRGGDALWGIGADLNCTRGGSDNVSTLLNLNGSRFTSNKDDPFCPKSADDEFLSPLVVMTDDIPDFFSIGDDAEKDNIKKATDSMSNSQEMECKNNEINAAIHDLVLRQKHSVRDILGYLRSYGGGYGKNFSSVRLHSLYKGDDDDEKNDSARPKNNKKKRDGMKPKKAWHDPTQMPLPYAPNLRIYCLYGVGIPTERAYYYKRNHDETGGGSGGTNGTTVTGAMPPTSFSDPPIVVDTSINDPDQAVKQGVRYVDGDGSVPLLSLGYLCTDAWKRPDSGLNPSNAAVITREYQHQTEFVVDDPMRGGPYSALHVDVLGNVDMMTDLLRIATDFEVDQVNQDQIVSDIERIAQEINIHPEGGIYGVSSRGQRRNWFGFLQRLK